VTAPRVLGALAMADFRDRARRPAFVVMLLAAAGLGYLAAPPTSTGYTMVKIGEFRGVYDSGYLGVMLAMAASLWLSLCGFYAIKNTIARDTATGVGQILAATPLSRAGYLLGKFLSNLMVLAAMVGVLALTGLGVLLLRGESDGVDLVALWLPFPLLCLPFLAVAAAAALVFESVRPLRGAAGNVVWFFGFLLLFLAGLGTTGLNTIGAGMQADLLAQHPGVVTEISIGLTAEEGGLDRFRWSGLDVTTGLVAQQLGLLLVAVLAALLPALWFTRFDPSRQHQPATRQTPAETTTAGGAPPAKAAFAGTARPRTPVMLGRPSLGLCAGELRVLLEGLPRWWWPGLLGLNAVALAVPAGGGPNVMLLLAWIWPVPLWSRLGSHTYEHDVHLLTGASAAPRRQLLAEWAAGAAVTALAGAGPLLRMLLDGDIPGAAAWLGGAAFIPALALLLGSLSRSARLFQLGYLMLWYAVFNGVPAVDFMGAVRAGDQGNQPALSPLLVLAAAAALLALTIFNQEVRHARR
jgi:ABC-type transport system involved in multi-copper enzyme maturation permease subunit